MQLKTTIMREAGINCQQDNTDPPGKNGRLFGNTRSDSVHTWQRGRGRVGSKWHARSTENCGRRSRAASAGEGAGTGRGRSPGIGNRAPLSSVGQSGAEDGSSGSEPSRKGGDSDGGGEVGTGENRIVGERGDEGWRAKYARGARRVAMTARGSHATKKARHKLGCPPSALGRESSRRTPPRSFLGDIRGDLMRECFRATLQRRHRR